jgi:hypothetical protein
MKAYKIELLVIDMDYVGGEDIRDILENNRYDNDCIAPIVMKVTEADIGEWRDGHPLNVRHTVDSEYERLFPNG